ncbi:MAG: glycine cleavage system aminomethyltransferase GcvT [Spirochaetes bacterium]|nr:glycine cleavage system aminomethyltransferase GcvT [Spirochaetota bacterium]
MTKRTPLYENHRELQAKFVDFAGWELPVMYTGIVEEHNATRKAAALFDVSHMGELMIRGRGAVALLARLLPTRLDKLGPGKTMYSMFCNDRGGVIDDLFVYMKGPEDYMLVVNAATKEGDCSWIRDHMVTGAELIDMSDEIAKIDLQGPASPIIAERVLGDPSVREMKRFAFGTFGFQGHEILVSRTGYTGETGYEMYVPGDVASGLWNELLAGGQGEGIKPAGLGARDTLRLEACYSLYGHELSTDISPVESGLSWVISSDESYIGREVLTGQLAQGAPREHVVFELEGRGIPREGYIIRRGGQEIGTVTSGTFSPTFQKGIGMGLVARGTATVGDAIEVVIRDKPAVARVARRPLYQFGGQRKQ